MNPAAALLYEILHRINSTWPNRLDEWMDRRYYASCGGPRIVWRFWFEVTGQGRGARRYMRRINRCRRAGAKAHADQDRAQIKPTVDRTPPECRS
jgi:hypothetical protein